MPFQALTERHCAHRGGRIPSTRQPLKSLSVARLCAAAPPTKGYPLSKYLQLARSERSFPSPAQPRQRHDQAPHIAPDCSGRDQRGIVALDVLSNLFAALRIRREAALRDFAADQRCLYKFLFKTLVEFIKSTVKRMKLRVRS